MTWRIVRQKTVKQQSQILHFYWNYLNVEDGPPKPVSRFVFSCTEDQFDDLVNRVRSQIRRDSDF